MTYKNYSLKVGNNTRLELTIMRPLPKIWFGVYKVGGGSMFNFEYCTRHTGAGFAIGKTRIEVTWVKIRPYEEAL